MKQIYTALILGFITIFHFSSYAQQPTVTPYTVCQGQTVSAGQGITATVGGSTTPSTLSGNLTSGGATYVRGSGNTQTSYSSSGTSVRYQTFTIIPPVSGTAAIPMLSTYDNYMTLYGGSFNPSSPATNFLYGDDDSYGGGQALITWNFTAGQTYILVAAAYGASTTGAFTINLPWTSGNVVEWYAAATGGTVLGTGGVFNPVGVAGSGITNTNTAGSTNFYAAYQGSTAARVPGAFNITAAPLVTNYATCVGATIPSGQGITATGTGTIEWYTTATATTPIATGATFNPVSTPGSGITNTNTAGTYTFYVQIQGGSACRVPATFTINPVIASTTGYTICQGLSVPAGQGLVANGTGGSTPSTLSGNIAAGLPTYVRGYGNLQTSYNSSGTTVRYQTFTIVAPVSGTFNVSMVGSYDNYLTLYANSFNPASPATNFLMGDDDSYGTNNNAQITWTFVAGQTYVLVAAPYSTGTGAYTINLPFTSGQPVVWYASATGGSVIGTGSPFNPVGVAGSGVPNTNTPGTYTFYATYAGTDCRIPAALTISNGVAVTPYVVCQGQTVPAGQGLQGSSVGTIQWFTSTTATTAIATGNVFNPVGVAGSGITNTNTPGVTTFYAQLQNSTCRIPVTFSIQATPTVTNYNICQSATVPAGQGLTATIGGSTTPTTLSGSLTATSPTYTRGSGNTQTSYSNSGTSVRYQTFTFVAPVSGTQTIPMLSSFDNYMTLYSGSFNPSSPTTNFLYGDDDSYGAAQALITWNFVAGQTYVLVAASYSSGVSGTFTIPLPFTSAMVTEWYTSTTATTPIATGGVFNPVGVAGSGIPNTNTAASTTFYVGYQGNSCRVPVVFNVNAATIISIGTSGSPTICQGSNVVLSAPTGSGYTYQWQLNTGNISGATSANFTAAAAGNYNVVVTGAGTCAIPASPVTVVVNPLPSATATITGPASVCQGNLVQLNANTGTGLSYQWKQNGLNIPGATTTAYSAGTGGSYSVTVTNTATGCSNTSTAAAVNVIPNPVSVITYSSPLSFCAGGGVVLNAYTANGLNYQWYKNTAPITGATNFNYLADSPGAYTLKITDAIGCTGTSQPVDVLVNAIPSPAIQRSNHTLSTGNYASYQWYMSSQPIQGANSQTYTFTQDGLYNVAVTDNNGCTGLSSTFYASTTGIATAGSKEGISIFPNPVKDIVYVKAGVPVNLQLKDLSGRLVKTVVSADKLDMAEVAEGMYMLIVTNKDGQLLTVERLVKTR